MRFTPRDIDQAHDEMKKTCGGVKEDYFGLLYIEDFHRVTRQQARNQIAFGGNDFGIDGFHFDIDRRILYLYQFKYSKSHALFRGSMERLIEAGLQQIFATPNKNDSKNNLLLQLRSCLIDNRTVIEQVSLRFVFTGDPTAADRSESLARLREDIENKKYILDSYFGRNDILFVVEFRSASGQVGALDLIQHNATFSIPFTNTISVKGPNSEKMHICLIRLVDLYQMHVALGQRLFDQNIRYWLGQDEAVNRAIAQTLRRIVIERSEPPELFCFNHNGITLYAEQLSEIDGTLQLTAPALLNGAQTVTTASRFIEDNKNDPRFELGRETLHSISLLCKIITGAERKFVTRVTVNNNRQNPVEPWNLHANDLIQLELQEKFRTDLGIYYERQENAFDQLSSEDLEEYGIKEDSKAIQMLKLTQTFLLSDGHLSRVSDMKRVFEEERQYDQAFRLSRLQADSRHIVLCYKIEKKLRLLSSAIVQMGANRYWFVNRARTLIWALLCQSVLNAEAEELELISESHGRTLAINSDYTEFLVRAATSRVRPLLSLLVDDPDYSVRAKEGNFSFLRTDAAFERCMKEAHRKWKWVHKKLE